MFGDADCHNLLYISFPLYSVCMSVVCMHVDVDVCVCVHVCVVGPVSSLVLHPWEAVTE